MRAWIVAAALAFLVNLVPTMATASPDSDDAVATAPDVASTHAAPVGTTAKCDKKGKPCKKGKDCKASNCKKEEQDDEDDDGGDGADDEDE